MSKNLKRMLQRWPCNGTMDCNCPKWCDDVNNSYPMLPEARRNH